ncbi:probable cardiolipin synthase (CMP-forming) [Battus philenor]|uniref:probable cardiolipin synthase (CMP-forming) n=1 Tax=Battus philenor TaxID=42288 RepID=UPI0035CFF1F4
MRFRPVSLVKQIQTLCLNHYSSIKTYSCLKVHTHLDKIKNNSVIDNVKHSSILYFYSSDSKKHLLNLEKKAEELKDVFEHKKEQIKETELRIRQRGVQLVKEIKQQKEITGQKIRVKREHMLKDLKETKAKVKEKIEEVVEKEKVLTIPNILCVARITMSPYLGYVILQDNYNLALGLLVFAGVSDLLDGWIARTWKSQSTKMGSFLDPMADKVLIATLFICLTWQDLIPLSLTLLIVARDAALVVAGFVIRYKSLPPPRTLSRYFDVTHATAQLAPTFISKVNTAIQLLLVGTTLASPVFDYIHHPALQVLCGVTAASTVVSAISYLVRKDTYKILKKKL